MNHMLTNEPGEYKLPKHWIDKEELPEEQPIELEDCQVCGNEIPCNVNSYKFRSTQFNKDIKCGCYDCYVYELENKIKPIL